MKHTVGPVGPVIPGTAGRGDGGEVVKCLATMLEMGTDLQGQGQEIAVQREQEPEPLGLELELAKNRVVVADCGWAEAEWVWEPEEPAWESE